jgi:hypothetical protein
VGLVLHQSVLLLDGVSVRQSSHGVVQSLPVELELVPGSPSNITLPRQFESEL